ncbi:hypothetical protein E4U42_007612 [Claviceps africana]|uniref:NADH dehydrogenase [ubiquinone] 1 alpha subcomplex subunit 1 n=1 Tax=Claviceps africana TaxID=83212 RepID=A0A8K0J0X7_9HYPO|nr:hypothetical protein E4U42_007612 [Claviceps africana]
MPVPFETLLPYAIMIGMFGITGTGLAVVKTWRNEGKRPRYSLDQWDRVCNYAPTQSKLSRQSLLTFVAAKLTGTLRGQVANPEAPSGFEFSNGWKLEKRFT